MIGWHPVSKHFNLLFIHSILIKCCIIFLKFIKGELVCANWWTTFSGIWRLWRSHLFQSFEIIIGCTLHVELRCVVQLNLNGILSIKFILSPFKKWSILTFLWQWCLSPLRRLRCIFTIRTILIAIQKIVGWSTLPNWWWSISVYLWVSLILVLNTLILVFIDNLNRIILNLQLGFNSSKFIWSFLHYLLNLIIFCTLLLFHHIFIIQFFTKRCLKRRIMDISWQIILHS